MRPIRVLYLQPAVAFGGAERQATYCIEGLPRHGVEVVPVVGPGREIVEALVARGVREYLYRGDLPSDRKAPRSLAARAALYAGYVRSYLRLADDLSRLARERHCDLVYASRPFAWVLGARVADGAGLPVVWRAGTMFEHWMQPRALAWFAQRHAPRAVIYTSEAVRDEIAPLVPAPRFVLHNGVDVTRFHPRRGVADLRAELGIAAATPVVAVVGRISPEKGIGMLLSLCARLQAALPGVRVLVAGDSGWRQRFAARCSAAGLDGTVRLLGFVREVERVYATADVVVSPSRSEGCPNAVLEAMAMGRAVVATRAGGTAEILRDGIDGCLVAPGDAWNMARLVAGLCTEPAWREDLGRAAAARVRERYSIERQVGELAQVLRWAARPRVIRPLPVESGGLRAA